MSQAFRSPGWLPALVLLAIAATAGVAGSADAGPKELTVAGPDPGPEALAPPKIQFRFLMFPAVVKTGAERTLTLCMVNRGATNTLDLAAGDRVTMSIPVGPTDGDLADAIGVQDLQCGSTAPGWSCATNVKVGSAEVVFEPAGAEVQMAAGETACFELEQLTVSDLEGLAFVTMAQEIRPSAASPPENTLLGIFKSAEGVIEHDDLAAVMADQHHVQTWDVSGDDIHTIFDGNVGIGTTVPQRKLHVAGAGLFGGELTLGGNRTSLAGFDGAGNHWLRTDGDESRLWMAFTQTGGQPTRIRIRPATDFDLTTGDLGVTRNLTVGSGAGGGRLLLRGTGVDDDLFKLVRLDNGNALRISTPHGDPSDATVPTSARFQVSENGLTYTTALSLVTRTGGCCTRGHVGIGTLKPRARLHVDGGSDVEPNDGGYLVVGDVAATNVAFDNNEIMARDNGSVADLFLQVDGGGVGIGVGSMPAGTLLAVDGKAMVEEVEVQLSQDWPDYVFADDYRLMPLDELRTHLARYRHLPGLPPAAEVGGSVALGSMQTKLLEKVEELTLYVLELNDDLDTLRRENERLRRDLAGPAGAGGR